MDHAHTLGACSFCHDGTLARGKGPTHITTTEECNVCHVPGDPTWAATGKPNDALHANVTDDCSACHSSGGQFIPVLQVDHSQVIGSCQACHDGVIATGKGPNHIATTQECNVCHVPGAPSWPASAFDHSGVIGQTCTQSGCHDGVAAIGKPNDQLHANVTDQCQACHGTGGGSFNPALRVDHNEVLGACQACHDGVVATGKPVGHIVTTEDCGACHNTTNWTAAVDHANLQGQACATAGCHDNDKPGGHISTTNVCEACHRPSPSQWTDIAGVDHAQVLGDCGSCHNGTDAIGKPGNHIDTSNVCDACHSNNAWRPVVTVDHNQINGVNQCVTCHNKPGGHPVNMDHSQAPQGSCSSCHNGAIAEGKNRGHCPTNQECDVCHGSTNDWENNVRDC